MDKKIEIVNAVIDSAYLGIEDHGILTVNVGLDYGGTHQGFGGYALDRYNKVIDRRIGSAFGTEFILQTMAVAGVADWSKLKGQTVRVKRVAEWSGKIIAIGHIIKDIWLEPELLASEYREREAVPHA